MLTPDVLRDAFDRALAYEPYVATGKPEHQENWHAFDQRVKLTEPQRTLLASFSRTLHVLAISGTWCGDCVQQLPFLRHAEAANPERLKVRFLDRDENLELAERVRICGGLRVPTVFLLNEDFEFLALAGDRTLSRYRAIAQRQLGPSCPLPGAPVPDDEIAATLQDWIDELERAHLMARLSTRLRQRHGD